MSFEIFLFSAVVLSGFLAFAGAFIWADYTTRHLRRGATGEPPALPQPAE